MDFLKRLKNAMDSNTAQKRDEHQFLKLTDAVFQQIETWLEAHSPDVDFMQTAPGVLEIETPKGHTIILNRHEVNGELWLASKRGAHHFRYDGKNWRDTRSDAPLFEVFEAILLQFI